jgi:spoIIIJ-associated protein
MNNEQLLEFAKKYLADLLSFYGVNVEVKATLTDDVIELSVPSTDSNSLLIGRNAETLRSMQFLLSTTLRNQGAETVRVNVDIADYKKQRAEKVAVQAKEWIEGVLQTGEPYIARINAADRRIVHHVAGEFPDVRTYSEGEGRDRRIVIAKQDA